MTPSMSARTGQQKRVRETKERIVEAATTLFQRDGYVETTMAAVAGEAGVAVQTLYLSFGSKSAILAAAHDTLVAADADDTPVLEQPWIARLRTEQDGRIALALVLDHALGITQRVSPIYTVIQAAAADFDVAAVLQRSKQQRLTTTLALAHELSVKSGFAAALSTRKAGDLLYAMVSDEQYRLLVIECGWSAEDWRTWCSRVLIAELFPGEHG